MKRTVVLLLLAASFAAAAEPVKKPKLVIAIIVDQFRHDYLTRYKDEFSGGFKRLLTEGAVYTNAHHEHFPTVTAVGHSVFLTGAMPATSGIIANDWYDRDTGGSTSPVSPMARSASWEARVPEAHLRDGCWWTPSETN